MSTTAEEPEVGQKSRARARARAAAAIAKLTEKSRQLGEHIKRGGAASTAALQSGLSRSSAKLKKAGGAAAATARNTAQTIATFGKSHVAPRLGNTGRNLAAKTKNAYKAAEAYTREKAAPWAADTSRKAATTSWHFTRHKAAPWLAQTARATRNRLRPSAVAEDYRRALIVAHEKVLDRGTEALLFVPVRHPLPTDKHQILNLRRLPGEAAHATPARVFQWAMEMIPESVEHFTFVEFGSGRGRTLLLASGHPFEKVVGIEPDQQLHSDCEMNIAQYPRSRMKCRNVECIFDDVLRAPLPEEKTVFYLFQHVDERTLGEIVAHIVTSYRQAPRRLYFLCVGVDNTQPLRASEIFEAVPTPRALAIKTRLLSPYPITLYRSIA